MHRILKVGSGYNTAVNEFYSHVRKVGECGKINLFDRKLGIEGFLRNFCNRSGNIAVIYKKLQ